MQTIFLSDLKVALLEHPQAWITQMEQQHWAQLRTIAEEIAEHRRTCPIILLSGPSGSGKTITAMMLEPFWMEWDWKRIRFPWITILKALPQSS